jgi:hypothetical protein
MQKHAKPALKIFTGHVQVVTYTGCCCVRFNTCRFTANGLQLIHKVIAGHEQGGEDAALHTMAVA